MRCGQSGLEGDKSGTDRGERSPGEEGSPAEPVSRCTPTLGFTSLPGLSPAGSPPSQLDMCRCLLLEHRNVKTSCAARPEAPEKLRRGVFSLATRG